MAARVDADMCQQWFQSFNISDSRGARRLPEVHVCTVPAEHLRHCQINLWVSASALVAHLVMSRLEVESSFTLLFVFCHKSTWFAKGTGVAIRRKLGLDRIRPRLWYIGDIAPFALSCLVSLAVGAEQSVSGGLGAVRRHGLRGPKNNAPSSHSHL